MSDHEEPATPVTAPWLLRILDDVPAGHAALALVSEACHPAVVHHSARTLRYALDIARREQLDVDPAALTHACLMHDLGASALAVGAERFEVQGADLAVRLLAEHGWAERDRHEVWTAIALHTTPHVAERLTPLTRLVRLGMRTDFGEELVEPDLRRSTETVHPRLRVEQVLGRTVVAHALRDERRAPAASWPAGLLAAHRTRSGPDGFLSAF